MQSQGHLLVHTCGHNAGTSTHLSQTHSQLGLQTEDDEEKPQNQRGLKDMGPVYSQCAPSVLGWVCRPGSSILGSVPALITALSKQGWPQTSSGLGEQRLVSGEVASERSDTGQGRPQLSQEPGVLGPFPSSWADGRVGTSLQLLEG